jgi:Tfp pilus assembly protein PilE
MFKRGFSTIEFLSVISAAAVLGSVALPSFNIMQDRANELRAVAELTQLKPLVEQYYTSYGNYPRELSLKEINRIGTVYQKNLKDPFTGEFYRLTTFPGKPHYFVLISAGPDKRYSTIVANDRLLNIGDDILVTNQPEE